MRSSRTRLNRFNRPPRRSALSIDHQSGRRIVGGVLSPPITNDFDSYSTVPAISGSWTVLNLSSITGFRAADETHAWVLQQFKAAGLRDAEMQTYTATQPTWHPKAWQVKVLASEKSGAGSGDVVVSFNGRDVYSSDELLQGLVQHAPGERVQLGVVHNGQTMNVTVTLGEAPVAS